MEREVVVIGAGPAGLSAAVAAAKAGAGVTVIDENRRPGGQLIKQIHKFFGRRENFAGMRGIDIGECLLAEARSLGVEVWLDSVVWGYFGESVLGILRKEKSLSLSFKKMLVAAGASEKVISFPGWTLPGVMGAGAAQTLINVHRVLPGRKVLMIGSGNVGLIVGYQLLQAGAQVSMVEALPAIGGYRVHADKIRRAGVPVFLSHSIKEGLGKEFIEGAVIHRLDRSFKPIPGTEKVLDVDTICLAVGLVPQVELLSQAGCKMIYSGRLGGFVPIHSPFMQTTEPDLFVAGDSAGIGEASSAMEEGRLAGLTMAKMLGSRSRRIEDERRRAQQRLGGLRKGPFGQPIRQAKEEVLKAWKKERIKTEIPKQVRDDIDRRSLLAV